MQTPCREIHVTPQDDSSDKEASVRNVTELETPVRVCTRSEVERTADPQVLLEGWSLEDIRQRQLEDQEVGPVLIAKEDGKRPDSQKISSMSSILKTLWRHWDRLEIHSGVLYRKWVDDNGNDSWLQLVVPTRLKQDVLTYHHDIPSSAHLGREKTLEKLKNVYY